ncbi:histidine kinase dimerization/phosphoacceptor domain -containing protein [Deltaproteobacteria bacterium TL4]
MFSLEIKVLLIEDNRMSAAVVEAMLGDREATSMIFPVDLQQYPLKTPFPEPPVVGNLEIHRKFEVVHAATFSAGLDCLTKGGFDVLILDLILPDKSGLEFFNKEYAELTDLPIVIYTEVDDMFLALQAVRHGAQEYLFKENGITSFGLIRTIQNAIERHRLCKQLKEYNRSIEQQIKVRTLELEKKTEQLEQKIIEHELGKEQLEKALKEKDVLLKEVHHRVKNNMAMMVSILQLQMKYVKHPEDLELFQESQNRIYTLALVYEKLYQTDNFCDVNFEHFIRELSDGLLSTYSMRPNQIQIKVETSGVKLDIGKAIPAGLILNELITKALKHAFPNGRRGQIQITAVQDLEGQVDLSISDDGIDLPEDFNTDKTTTLGTKLINVLTDQLGGSLKREQSQPTGTTVKIIFPTIDEID